MKPLIVVVLVTWMIILQLPVRAVTTFRLDLKKPTAKKYADFLQEIRDNVKDPDLHYEETHIPVMKANPDPKFIRIDLVGETGTASLAVERNRLYVLGYLAENDKNIFLAHYFKGKMTAAEINEVFSEAQGDHQQIGFNETYGGIEDAAKTTRIAAGLGIGKLIEYMGEVIRKPHNKINEAKFILLAVETVSEATRFEYIAKLVVGDYLSQQDIIEIDYSKVILLENFWGNISAEIKLHSKHGKFKPALKLERKYKGVLMQWTVEKVEDLKMGILMNISTNGLFLWIIIGIIMVVLVVFILFCYYISFTKAKSHGVNKTD